jgi:hypothetical protein
MKTLEKKILNKVYAYETKKTILEIVADSAGMVLFGLMTVLIGWALVDILVEQGSFAMFEILTEDFEIMKDYLLDTVYVFYLEIPKLILIFLVIVFMSFIILIFNTIKNSRSIIKRVKSIARFWRSL